MKMIIYGVGWAYGAPNPQDVLKRFVASEPTLILGTDKIAPHFEVEITADELMNMVAAKEFDILISAAGFVAFDAKGKCFRQR